MQITMTLLTYRARRSGKGLTVSLSIDEIVSIKKFDKQLGPRVPEQARRSVNGFRFTGSDGPLDGG